MNRTALPVAAAVALALSAGQAGAIDSSAVTRPKGYSPYAGNHAELVEEGKKLWNDPKLSTNGLSCNSCHQGNNGFQPTFAKAYPHRVEMAASQAGMPTIHLDEMVQLCLVAPMATKPLPWHSRRLAALTAYAAEVQKTFNASGGKAANPCAAKTANPCAANPCAVKAANPCAVKTMNPCATKNQ